MDLGDYDRWKLTSDMDEWPREVECDEEYESPWCDSCGKRTENVTCAFGELLCDKCLEKEETP